MLMLLLTGSMCSPHKDDDPVKKIDFYTVSAKKNTLSAAWDDDTPENIAPLITRFLE